MIHRDIKPENILLHDGRALVADFGIALAASKAGGTRMTETGMSLGTPHYMSPEQAMGERELDARSDVYALGSVLYEMLTGEPPFTGPTAQAIVAKVVTAEPVAPSTLRKAVPPEVESAVLTALEKLPADRFASAAEFAAALNPPVSMARRAGGTWLQRHATPLVVGLALLAAAAGAAAIGAAITSTPAEVNRFGLALGTTEGLSPVAGNRVTWAPDGRAFAYIGSGGGVGDNRLWLRPLDALAPTAIAGTEGATNPFFSPDGQQIGFITLTPLALRIVPRGGGRAATIVSDGVAPGGADWSRDGYIYFDAGSSLSRVRPDGSGREVVFALDSVAGEIGVAWPEVLPGDRGVICRVRRAGDDLGSFRIFVVDLRTRKRKPLVAATFARYAAPGYLLYVRADASLMAARFDLKRLELTGVPVVVARGLGLAAFGAADLAVSVTGTVLYSVGRGTNVSEPLWVSRDGTAAPVDTGLRGLSTSGLALSPDGSRLAVHLLRGSTTRREDIWVKHLPDGPLSRVTFEGEQNRRPSWSHDGRDILFLSSRSGPSALYRQRADGGAAPERIAELPGGIADGFESPDGRWLILRSGIASAGDGDILALRIGVDTSPKPIIATGFQELAPALSPDARWLAYTSNETGRPEVYVRPFPNVNDGKLQVSTEGGTEPRWSRRGEELFYRSANGDLMSARLRAAPALAILGRQRLFSARRYVAGVAQAVYDVSPDGRRFLMLRIGAGPGSGDDASQLILEQNFAAELRRVLP